MTDLSPIIAGAATMLAARRNSGEQGPRLPDWCRPSDSDTALAIQTSVAARLKAVTGGWKCGLPVADGPVLAPIHAGTIHRVSPCTALARSGHVRVEPELAFILGHDLPPRAAPYTPAEVDAAIVATHLALELIDSRYAVPSEIGFIEHLADGLLNQGLFLGPEVDSGQARGAANLALRLQIGTGTETLLDGAHSATDPRAPLYWLAEFLRGRGQGLQAGQVVITGSYAGSIDLPIGQNISIGYGELGMLAVHFVAQ